ncbi:MAG: hypothetical protein E8D46_17690 [Nitrospira sp.]|nr:MAG: hypothetical protein E8D46_17690 [Nitrospira sp.]
MRLAFVHGINNENNTPESIANVWWDALVAGWKAAGLMPKPKPDISVGYYADLLGGGTSSAAVEMGPSGSSTGLAAGLLQEYADAADVSPDELRAVTAELGLPAEAVAQGAPHEGWIVGFASVLERVLPTKGKLMARLFLRQAVTYINDRALAAQIDRKVSSQIFGAKSDPVIVIAHSLGTVVSYRILASGAAAGRQVPLFVTLGSPLSVRMFKSILPARSSIPNPPIGRWFNGRHKEDFVTLGRAITQQSIGFPDVVDQTDIVNKDDDKHTIIHYLASPSVAREIYAQI